MSKLTYRLVLPLTILSFFIGSQLWIALPDDAPVSKLWGFPFAYACTGWHTSMSFQFFLLEFILDFIIYFLAWNLIIFLLSKILGSIHVGKIPFIILLTLSILTTIFSGFIIFRDDNMFHTKRTFKIKVFEKRWEFIWETESQATIEYYEIKSKN